MKQQKFKVTIEGTAPYMQHRMDDQKLEDWEKKRGLIIENGDVNKGDKVRAEYHCYRNEDGKCFFPTAQLKRSMIMAGTYVKGKVGAQTKSMKSTVAGMFRIPEMEIPLPDYDVIDKRSTINKNNKARVMVIRPQWTNWGFSFVLVVNNDTITKETIKDIVEHAGWFVGVGSFRPTCNGEFGTFEVTKFERISNGVNGS